MSNPDEEDDKPIVALDEGDIAILKTYVSGSFGFVFFLFFFFCGSFSIVYRLYVVLCCEIM